MNRVRLRPAVHFSPERGWVNDPYGVYWDGSRYHLYFQAIAEATEWSPRCCWGHAVSEDLLSWREQPLVLRPQPFETGCWSGCVVATDSGAARAFYTRVQLPDLDLGRVAVARFDQAGSGLSSGPGDVVATPPQGVAVNAFRDPYVLAHAGSWTMVVGGGTGDGAGAVFCYRSEDLDRWTFTGILCHGRIPGYGCSASQVWECPQLLQIDGVWVLVLSAQLDGGPGPVMAAVGSWDEDGFTVHRWQRLASGAAPYATGAFRDRDGHPCMISWLREAPDHPAGVHTWAGAESLVAELRIDSTGSVAVSPHRSYTGTSAFTELRAGSSPVRYDADSGSAVRLSVPAGEPFEIEIHAAGRRLGWVRRAAGASPVVLDRFGHDADVLTGNDPAVGTAVFLDADILEVFADGAYGAWRI